MAVSVMTGSAWHSATSLSVMVSGAWHAAKAAWVMTSGAWHQIFTATLATPTGLSVSDTTACVSGTPSYKAHLAWTNGDASLQVRVYDGTTLIATLSAGTTSYDNTGLTHDSAHSYTVKHYNGTIEGPSSNTASITIQSNPCLAAPTITATDQSACVSGSASYKVHVAITSSTTWGHRIYRGGVLVATLAAGISSWDDTSVTASTTYNYTATEYDNPDESAESSTATIQVQSNPCTPTAADPTAISGSDSSFCDGTNTPNYQMDVSFTPANTNLSHRVYVDGSLYETLSPGVTGDSIPVSSGGNHTVRITGYNGTTESSPGKSVTVFLANPCA